MYCLLCHEKIPRLRAWRTKSEFCSDEHAALYKKQTLERLLTDQNAARKKPPTPLPLAQEERAEPLHDEMATPPLAPVISSQNRQPALQREDAFISAFESEMEESQEGVEELWRLAEEVGRPERQQSSYASLGRGVGEPPDEVRSQSAEEALRALRMLAAKGSADRNAGDRDAVFERLTGDPAPPGPAPRALTGEESGPFDDALLGDLDADFSSLEEMLDPAAETLFPPATSDDEPRRPRQSRSAPANDDGPSILERLLEEPSVDWRGPESRPGEQPQPARAEAADALPTLDDAPEPDFELEAPDAFETEPQPEEIRGEVPDGALARLLADEIEELGEIDEEADPLAELLRSEPLERENAESPVAGSRDSGADADLPSDRGDLDELQRNVKIVPFPGPDREPYRNGTKDHAPEIAALADTKLDEQPLPDRAGAPRPAVRPAASGDRSRAGKLRTRFKPSLVMAGVEPSMRGFAGGDPLESWRRRAVESAWGEKGLPEAYGFEASPLCGLDQATGSMEAYRPGRTFRGRMNLPMTLCRPAEPVGAEEPTPVLEVVRGDQPPQGPEALVSDPDAAWRLSPRYSAFDGSVAVGLEPALGELDPAWRDLEARLRIGDAPAAPAGMFFDSVPPDELLLEDEEWDSVEAVEASFDGPEPSDEFLNEPQTAPSAAGMRGGRYR